MFTKLTHWWEGKKIQEENSVLVVKQQLENSRKESQKLRRALRSTYRTEIMGSITSPSVVRGVDRLPFRTLRQIYKKSSSVRSCVDTISREVSNLKWKIEIKKGFPGNNQEHLDIAKDFFTNPNFDQESFGQILSKFLTDLLVLDAGVLEKVWSIGKKNLLEIVARDGAEFIPMLDPKGYLLGYQQRPEEITRERVDFTKEEIMYLSFYPQTNSIFGNPTIDSIVDEVATLLFATQYVATSFTEDEIPPGILNLGVIGEEAYVRFKRSIKEERGRKKDRFLRVIFGPEKVQWIELKRPNREMQTAELMTKIERVIYRNFGITPVQMGQTEKVPRASAEVQLEISRSKMVAPLVNLLNFHINQDIIQQGFGFNDVEFSLVLEDVEGEEPKARSAKLYIDSGIMTRDEARHKYLGMGPLPDDLGSHIYLIQDNQFIPLGKTPIGPLVTEVANPVISPENGKKEVSLLTEEKSSVPEPVITKALIKHIPLEELDELIDSYHVQMQKYWEDAKKDLVDKTKEEEKPSKKALLLISNLLFLRLKNASKKFYPKALALGVKASIDVTGISSLVTNNEQQTILGKAYKENQGFLKNNLIKDLKKKFAEEVEGQSYVTQVEKALDSLVFRLEGYAGALNGVAHEGFVTGIFKQEKALIHWMNRRDNKECGDCRGMGAGSPYVSRETMKFLPGQGTQCSGRCRCFLSFSEQ